MSNAYNHKFNGTRSRLNGQYTGNGVSVGTDCAHAEVIRAFAPHAVAAKLSEQ